MPYIVTVYYNNGKIKAYVFPSQNAYAFAERQRMKGHRAIIERIKGQVLD